MKRVTGVLFGSIAALTGTSIGEAQQQQLGIATAVAPETVTVGDPFTSVVRVMAPPGAVVEFRGVQLADSVQAVDTVLVIGAAADSGATAAYRLVAWVAAPVTVTADVRVVYSDSSEALYGVPLAVPVLSSVLPPGELPPPRLGRGVVPLDGGAVLWPWVLAAGAVALALLLLAVVRRRRPPRAELADPRPAALAALAEIESERDPALQYERSARVLRRYLADLDPAWGEEWTTTELLYRLSALPTPPAPVPGATGPGGMLAPAAPDHPGAPMRALEVLDPQERPGALPIEAVRVLADLLDRADRVKFAGVRPGREAGFEFVARSREWIESYPAPAPGAGRAREAA